MNKLNVDKIKVVMFDLDGTVYYGDKIIPGANDVIRKFREIGKKVYFTTNNSTKTRHQIYERLVNMGVDVEEEEVLTSGYLAAQYAKKNEFKNICVLGSENLITELEQQGVCVHQQEDAENLLIGYHPDINYDDMTLAVRVALHADNIIACNRERTYPGKDAKLFPGCGAMTSVVEWCANRPCDIIIGKPNTMMITYLCHQNKIDSSEILMIGDTYESDIVMANEAGSESILVGHERKYVRSVDKISDIIGFI